MNAKIQMQTMSIDELLNAKASYNPRSINKRARRGLEQSIKKFGYIDPIIYNKRTKTIVSGHQRLDVMQEEGYTEIDVSVIDVPLSTEKKLNITLNNYLITGDFTQELTAMLDELDIDFIDGTFAGELDIFGSKEQEQKEEPKKSKDVKGMDLLPYESYDCILIITETKNDFNYLKEFLGIKKVNASTAYDKNKTKIAETRAVKGSDLIKKLEEIKNEASKFEL